MEQKEREKIIRLALHQAQQAFLQQEIPVGAVIFHSKTGQIIAKAHNKSEQKKSPLNHAEMIVISQALKKIQDKFLTGYSMFVTLEPCAMCAGAIAWARLDALYYGASDPKTGAVEQGAQVFSHPQTHHKIKVEKWHIPECGQIMTDFFKGKRK
ncbi:MAG: nucleoside deaminase [Alphaproteobacteria bacterium]|nr:nucleoside deaminase [Alphaproteobacteria bacterium]